MSSSIITRPCAVRGAVAASATATATATMSSSATASATFAAVALMRSVLVYCSGGRRSSSSSSSGNAGTIQIGQKRMRKNCHGEDWTGSRRCFHGVGGGDDGRWGSVEDGNGVRMVERDGGAGKTGSAGGYTCLYRLQRRQLEFRRHPPMLLRQQQQQRQQRRWARVHDVQFVKARDRSNRDASGRVKGKDEVMGRTGSEKDGGGASTGGQKGSVMERYREKLDRKAREKGLKDVGELREAFKGQIERVRSEASRLGPAVASSIPRSNESANQEAKANTSTSNTATTTTTTANTSYTSQPPKGLKTLSSYLDITKIRALPPKEIEALWRLRHSRDARSLVATLTAEKYARMAATARRYPKFVLPIPRPVEDGDKAGDKASDKAVEEGKNTAERVQGQAQEQGPGHDRKEAQKEGRVSGSSGTATAADIHLLEWTFPAPQTTVLLFTSLAEYKLRQEYAVPHTTVSMHLELVDGVGGNSNSNINTVEAITTPGPDSGPGPGPVLLHGTVMKDTGVSVDDARWLLMCVQRFYGGSGTFPSFPSSSSSFSAAASSSSPPSTSTLANSHSHSHSHSQTREAKLLDMFTRGDAAFDIGQVLDAVQRLG